MSNDDTLAQDFQRTHPKSVALHQRARELFPAQGATHFSRVRSPFRPYIVEARGSRKWDADGAEYIDYVMGHGALVLGHAHPAVVAAIQAQAAKGIHYGDNHPLEVEWAERIRRLMPVAERIELFASGMEANLMAIRLARSFTGRRRILRFQHNYHGWADELGPPDAGGAVADLVDVIPPNDVALLEQRLATRAYALVIAEGGGGRVAGRLPMAPDFYRALPELARRFGTVFLLDEVVTGFREAPGGWQSVVGIRPDLTSIGKAASGGLPSGLLIGRADVLGLLSPETAPNRLVVHGGTWNAVPLTCAAGIAACDAYVGGAPQARARAMADRLRRGANGAFRRLGVNFRLYGRNILHLYFGDVDFEPTDDAAPPTNDVAKLFSPAAAPLHKRIDLHLLTRGVASMRGEALSLSAAHTDADVDQTIEALESSAAALVEENLLSRARATV